MRQRVLRVWLCFAPRLPIQVSMRSSVGVERSASSTSNSSAVQPWVWFLGCQLALIAAFVGCGLLGYAIAANVLGCAVNLVAVVAVAKGVVMHRPRSWAAWLLLGGSQLAFAIGQIVFFVSNDIFHDHSFPALADGVYLLLLYPMMIAALVIFVRTRTPGWHTATVIDAAVLATSAALLTWIYLMRPMSAAPNMTMLARGVGLAYPVMDLAILALALRLALGSGQRTKAYYLLVGSLVMQMTTDTVYLAQLLAGTFTTSSPVVFGALASSTLLGVAVLHPSMPQMDERAVADPPAATPGRLVILAIAALVAPTVLAVQYLRGSRDDTIVIAVVCAILFSLVLARMAGLVAAQRRMAITDPLTGLHTRRFFEPSLELEAKRSARTGASLGILFIDLDHFKRVNDTYGHQAGDEVLIELARRLRMWCRSGDVIARYGGEEFAVLIPGVDAGQLSNRAESLRRAVADAPMAIGRHPDLRVTASIGTAVFPEDAATPDDAVRRADKAMYEAKNAGRNRVVAAGIAAAAAAVERVEQPDPVSVAGRGTVGSDGRGTG